MAEMLLINPRRRKARRANPVAKRRVRRRNPAAALARRRRRNPMPIVAARRRNPIGLARRRVMRRRRNPAGRMGAGMLMQAIREAFVGGVGSVAVDLAMGQINKVLPATLKVTPGSIGAGDAVKALATVALGHFLSGPTRGLSRKMAQGALTVQAANIVKSFVPATMAMGYASPARIVNGSNTVGPNMGMGAYTKGSPLLNAYTKPNVTPLLSAARSSAMSRESKYVFAR